MPTTPDYMRNRYFMPLFTLFLGALVFTAFAIGGDVTNGLFAIPLFVGIATSPPPRPRAPS